MDEKRRAARWRKRRIIYNNDGNDVREAWTGVEHRHDVEEKLLTRSGAELIDDFLNARSRPLVGTQVDSIGYCTCMAGVTFSHHTKLGGFYGKGAPQELVEKYGRDNLQIQTDFCHENDIEVFWSLRMNDAADSFPKGSRRWTFALDHFKREHPEYVMGEPEEWVEGLAHNKYWSYLDFSYQQVREHVFSLIQEVVHNYDVDGIEMDFFKRFPYFRETLDWLPVEQEHLDMMTDLVRRLRKMADEAGQQRGCPVLLAARAPFNLPDARFIGLDLEKWLQEDLVDILIPGGRYESEMTESFKEIVDLGHKYDVPVYPCIDWSFWGHWAFLDLGAREHRKFESWLSTLYGGQPARRGKPSYAMTFNSWEGTTAAWRGAATNLFNAGADGIHTFNAFFAQHDLWKEIGDPATMTGKDKIFGVDRFGGDSSFNDVRELELKQGGPVGVHFQVGEDVGSGNAAELRFRLHLWEFTSNDDIDVKLNNEPLDDLMPAGPAQTHSAGQWLECQLRPSQVNRGENRVELVARKRDESMQKPLVLDAVQLHVHYKG